MVSSALSSYPLRKRVSKRKSSKRILRPKTKMIDLQTFSEVRRPHRQILRWIVVFMVCFIATFPAIELTSNSVLGPTTAVHLLHSQPTISSRIYESYDQRYHHTWEVSKNGNGLISVQSMPSDDKQMPHPKPMDLRLDPEVVQQLVNAYFKDISPTLPIITQAEFLSNPSPPPILLYSMCLVAAARREVPQSVFDSIRYAVNGVIKTEDVLSTASIANVQALLILSMVGDCHSQYVPNALSALWIRLGTAVRMVSVDAGKPLRLFNNHARPKISAYTEQSRSNKI